MHVRRVLTTAAVCLLPLTLAQPAFAYFDNFINHTVVGSMNQAESASFSKAVRQVLVDGEDGTPLPWTAAARKGREAIEGSITPLRGKTDQGQSCRQLKAELTRGSSHDEWIGWFCKQADGRWKSRKVSAD